MIIIKIGKSFDNSQITMSEPETSITLNQWQQLTRQGNMCFHANSPAKATQLYQQALALALQAYAEESVEPTLFGASLLSVIASYHNLAEVFKQQNKPQETLFHLAAADEFVLSEIEKFKADARLIYLLKARNKTLLALNLHAKQHPNSHKQKESTP